MKWNKIKLIRRKARECDKIKANPRKDKKDVYRIRRGKKIKTLYDTVWKRTGEDRSAQNSFLIEHNPIEIEVKLLKVR